MPDYHFKQMEYTLPEEYRRRRADAHCGSVGDGEPAEGALPDDARAMRAHLGRHLALLVPDWMGDDVSEAGVTTALLLQDSGLLVVTR